MKTLRAQLNQVCGVTIDDKDFIEIVMDGLDQECDDFERHIDFSKDDLKFDDFVPMLHSAVSNILGPLQGWTACSWVCRSSSHSACNRRAAPQQHVKRSHCRVTAIRRG